MTARRTLAVLGLAPVLLLALAPAPARAHGAPSNPVSRALACASAARTSPACVAAVAAGDGRSFDDWDNLRLANVRGRDRTMVPDGRLCSAGLARYAGLDLPRRDWPVTRLRAGARFTFTYRSTIPHRGTFRLYLTRTGYDPTRPLRWSDLDSRPFLTVTDPALRGGAYVTTGVLPARTGRHVIYTVWQNSSTPDTYYSCSDVVLTGAGGGAPRTASPTRPVAPARAAVPAATAAAATPTATPTPSGRALDRVARVADDPASRLTLPLAAGGATLLAVGAAVALLRRRRTAASRGEQ